MHLTFHARLATNCSYIGAHTKLNLSHLRMVKENKSEWDNTFLMLLSKLHLLDSTGTAELLIRSSIHPGAASLTFLSSDLENQAIFLNLIPSCRKS